MGRAKWTSNAIDAMMTGPVFGAAPEPGRQASNNRGTRRSSDKKRAGQGGREKELKTGHLLFFFWSCAYARFRLRGPGADDWGRTEGGRNQNVDRTVALARFSVGYSGFGAPCAMACGRRSGPVLPCTEPQDGMLGVFGSCLKGCTARDLSTSGAEFSRLMTSVRDGLLSALAHRSLVFLC